MANAILNFHFDYLKPSLRLFHDPHLGLVKYKPLSYAVSVRELSELFTWLALWVYRCRKEVLKVVVDSKGPKYGLKQKPSSPHQTTLRLEF